MKRKIVLLFVIFAITIFPIQAFATNESTINIIINGKAVEFTEDSGYPFIDENSRTMVPLRVTMEAAGAAVGYDPDTHTAIVITEHDRIEVPIGTDYMYNNNVKIQNDTNSVIKNGRTFLPIRAVLESADFTVEWDGQTETVNAYNFSYDSTALVPYSTSNIFTLLEELLKGNVIYLNGQYYATPDYVKMLQNTVVHYSGDDLNKAIYPLPSRFDFADFNP